MAAARSWRVVLLSRASQMPTIGFPHLAEEAPFDDALHGAEGVPSPGPDIQEHRRQQRLHRVRQGVAQVHGAGLARRARAPAQLDAQIQRPLVQRVGADQKPPELGQGPFRPVGVLAVDQDGDGEVQHRIAQELQALIVLRQAGRRRGQGGPEQAGILEPVAEAPFQGRRRAGLG